jgi:hypothetical protein
MRRQVVAGPPAHRGPIWPHTYRAVVIFPSFFFPFFFLYFFTKKQIRCILVQRAA